ncbi:MAG: hypothetical protein HY035_06745 [Nitrospirae bacterium]|nr:hypothetical protein [Nitrospirota bacterium]MBI3378079.1 hypothetical protein [Nitrospirota bacterium]
MGKRKIIIILLSLFLFTAVNVFFHYMTARRFGISPYLILYIAVVNGIIPGFAAGHFLNKLFEKRDIKIKFLSIGVAIGLFLSLPWVNNQIDVEFYINKDRLNLIPPYVSYFRFYLIGLALGILKSFYYAFVPSIVLFTGVGFLIEQVVKTIKRKNK